MHAWFSSLAFLRRLDRASRSDLIENNLGFFFSCLLCQMFWRKLPIIHTIGNSFEVSTSRFRIRICMLVNPGAWVWRHWRRRLPALLLKLQRKKVWSRFSTSPFWQSWQWDDGFLFLIILLSLSWVGMSLWTSLHRKVVVTGPRPFSLASLQVLVQSFSGLASSVRQGEYTLGEVSSRVDMVKLSSSSRVYHWLLVMVATLRGEDSWTFLIVEKKSWE